MSFAVQNGLLTSKLCYTQCSRRRRESLPSSKTFTLVLYIKLMSYELSNREQVVNTLTSRVIENAPLRELIRVYSEAVQSAIANLSDADVVRSIAAAGYTDIIEAFTLEVPAAEVTEGEATPVETEVA